MRTSVKTVAAPSGEQSDNMRISRCDWETLSGDLNAHGCAVLEKLLSPDECREIAALYPDEARFRSHVHMARHGFGKGEYRYFKYPLPELLGDYGPRSTRPLRRSPTTGTRAWAWSNDTRTGTALFCNSATMPVKRVRRRCCSSMCRRFQLLASGPLWRSGFPTSGRNPALRAGAGF